MGDKNPKHPLKKKKATAKTCTAGQEISENSGSTKKHKKHNTYE